MDNNTKYSETRIGKVLNVENNPKEPVMTIVAAKDAEVGGIAVDRLRSFIERIERLEEERHELAKDVASIFAEAKGEGYDVKALRAVLKLRKMDAGERQEQEYLLETYCKALEM